MSSNELKGKAKKDKVGKPDLAQIPYVAEVAAAGAFEVGKKKYGMYNYTKGLTASELVSAIKRHVGKWFGGEEYDPDGQHHLGAIIADCAIILRQQELGTLIDDRYTAIGVVDNEEKPSQLQLELKNEVERIAKSAQFIYGDSQDFSVKAGEIEARYDNKK